MAYIFGYPVTLEVIDDTRTFTITRVGEGQASIVALIVRCIQPDGTAVDFDILAGQTPTCLPGPGNIIFQTAYIVVRNVGTATDTIFMRVTDDTGAQLYYLEADLPPGGQMGNVAFTVDMPDRNYTITVEAGHK